MSQPSSRQELYDRIRRSSKDEVILEEMIRLGFWPASQDQPGDPAEEIRRRGELERTLRALLTEKLRLQDLQALERAAYERRLAESRQKRAQNKERKLRERAERAAAWRARKAQDITYLGKGVSAGLAETTGNPEQLASQGLPVLGTAADIAAAMGITVAELRFLAFTRQTSKTTHYARFTIPKRTGGQRVISAPMPRLKAAQQWILRNVLQRCSAHPAAHGFCQDRSIVTNARPHVGAAVVVNVDLENFFPTVSYRRVKGLFAHLGYSEAAATIFALLCTEPEIMTVELDGTRYHVAVGERFLPQGAPTSPAITNLLCRRLDRRLDAMSRALGFTSYTRYADDLTFSGPEAAVEQAGRLLRRISWIASREGFTVHPRKTRVLRQSRRQEVTGIVVNERLGIARDTLRRFRATLYQIEKDGPEGKRWGQSDDVIAAIVGFANYVAMVDPHKGKELRSRALALAERYGHPTASKPPAAAPAGSAAPAVDSAPSGPATHASQSAEPDGPDDTPTPKTKKWWQIF